MTGLHPSSRHVQGRNYERQQLANIILRTNMQHISLAECRECTVAAKEAGIFRSMVPARTLDDLTGELGTCEHSAG
jgi:hypothetical protein